MPKLPEFDPIEFLLVRKFGVPGVFGGLTLPTSFERLSADDSDVSAQIEDYRSYLQKLPKGDFEALVASELTKEKQERIEKDKREEELRFFNQPNAQADFDHWSRMAHWTLDEAIALSFGKAPEIVTWEKVKPFTHISPFAFQYQRRRDIALRAKDWQQVYDPVLPGIFLAWAQRLDLRVPRELVAAVTARGVKIRDWQSLYDELKKQYDDDHARWIEIVKERDKLIDALRAQLDEHQSEEGSSASEPDAPEEKTLSVRERESLLKLVIGMALGGYGYDPRATRSGTSREIASDLQKAGVSLDQDTVRKYLTEARELLSGDKAAEAD